MPVMLTYQSVEQLRALALQEQDNQVLSTWAAVSPQNSGGMLLANNATANSIKAIVEGVDCYDIGRDRQLILAGDVISLLAIANVWEPETWDVKVAGNVISSERLGAILESVKVVPGILAQEKQFSSPLDFIKFFSSMPTQVKEEHRQRVRNAQTEAFEDSEFDVSKLQEGEIKTFMQELTYGNLVQNGYGGGNELAIALYFGLNHCYLEDLGVECTNFLDTLLMAARNVSSLKRDPNAPAKFKEAMTCLRSMQVPEHWMRSVSGRENTKANRMRLWEDVAEYNWGQHNEQRKEKIELSYLKYLISRPIARLRGERNVEDFEVELRHLADKVGVPYSRSIVFFQSLETAMEKLDSAEVEKAYQADEPVVAMCGVFEAHAEAKERSGATKKGQLTVGSFFAKANGQMVYQIVVEGRTSYDRFEKQFMDGQRNHRLKDAFTELYEKRSPLGMVIVKILIATSNPGISTGPLAQIASQIHGSCPRLLGEMMVFVLARNASQQMWETLKQFEASEELVSAVRTGMLTEELLLAEASRLRSIQYGNKEPVEYKDVCKSKVTEILLDTLVAIMKAVGLRDYSGRGPRASPEEPDDGSSHSAGELRGMGGSMRQPPAAQGNEEKHTFGDCCDVLVSWAESIVEGQSSQAHLKPKLKEGISILVKDVNHVIKTCLVQAVPNQKLPASPRPPGSMFDTFAAEVSQGRVIAHALGAAGFDVNMTGSVGETTLTEPPRKKARKEKKDLRVSAEEFVPHQERMSMNADGTWLSMPRASGKGVFKLDVSKFKRDCPGCCPYMALTARGDARYCPLQDADHKGGRNAPAHDKSKYPVGLWVIGSDTRKKYVPDSN